VLFQITDQDYLSNVTNIIGGTGVDTLKFSRDGVSITDENVANLTSIDVLRTANGNNRFLFDDAYLIAGIETIIGGTGRDTIDMASDMLYTPGSDADIITVDVSAGAGYTLVSTTHNFAYAKVIGSSANKGAVIVDGANLFDNDFVNMYQGNIGTLTMRDQTPVIVTLAEMAAASGLNQLQLGGGGDLVDVTDFTKELTIRGAAGNDIVTTSFAALSKLTFIGGDDIDILSLADAEARSITSLSGDFEAFALENGNNFVLLENEASRGGITRIIGGRGFDTLSAINLTTGIDFQVFGNRMGNGNTDASIQGGSGIDTLSVDFLNPSVLNNFTDFDFERVGSFGRLDGVGAIEAFNTQADGQNYTFGRNAFLAGIRTIYGHGGDVLVASTYDDDGDPATTNGPSLNFVFATSADLFGDTAAGFFRNTDITGSVNTRDTITLTTAQQTIFAGDFANHTGVERLVLADALNDILLGSTVALDADSENAGIQEVVFGVGRDILGFDSTINTSFTLQGGSGNDLAFLGDAAATLGDAAFTDWTSIEEFRVNVANGDNDITFGLQAQESGIVTMVGGANNDTLNASAYTTASVTLSGAAGDDSLLSGAASDSLFGGDGNDTLSGRAGNDTIVAGSGDDSITGGEGVDSLLGGDGNDTFEYTSLGALASDASVDGGANDDRIKFTGVVSYIITGEIDSAFAKVSGFEIVELATGVSNRFNLTTVVATAGIGTIVGGSGNDTIDAATALSAVSLSGAGGRDSIIGGFGSDNLLGGDGDDTIVGAQDDALLDGGADTTDDWLQVGSNFNDTGDGQIVNIEKVEVTATGLTVNLGDQTEGFNVIGFATGATTLLGGSGADTFTGGSGADWLQGTSALTAGANQIDTLTGDVGNDTFVLGDAVNAYYNTAVNGGDFAVITDFAAGDKLQLKTLDGAAAGNGYLIGNQIYGAVGSSNFYLYRDSNNNNAIEAGDNLIAAINSSVALTTVNLKSTHGLFV
jgi:Ca2+-binding RTX toxin-like protein